MLERLKRTLVESFIGAIALGYVLAQVIWHFVDIFVSPVSAWVTENELRNFTPHTTTSTGSYLQDALPELAAFLLLLLVWYVLLRWLYFKPFKKETAEPRPNQGQVA